MSLQCDGFMLVALEGVDPDCKVDWGQEEARGGAAGIFVWWFVCFRYADLELRTAQQNTCKFQKMTQRVFDVSRVPNVWGTFFGVSGYMDIQIEEFKLFSKFQGEDFGRFVWCFRCSCEFLGWYRLFIGMWVSPSRMLARHQPDYRIPSCSPLISTQHPGRCSSTAMLSQGRQRAGRGDSRSRKFDEPLKEHKTLENIAIILHRINVWYNYTHIWFIFIVMYW